MNASLRPDEREIVLHTAVARRWLSIVVVTAIFASLALAYSLVRPTSYVSSARLLLRPLPANPLSARTTSSSKQVALAMSSEAALVTAVDVMQAAGQLLGEPGPVATSDIGTAVVANAEGLVIRFHAATAAQARAGAQAVAEAFLQYRSDKTSAARTTQIAALQKRAKLARAGMGIAAGQLNAPHPPPDAKSRVNIFAGQLATLQQQIGTATSTPSDPGTVTSAATAAVVSGGVPTLLVVALVAAVALAVAVAVAIWRSANLNVTSAEAFTAIRGRPVLSVPGRGSVTSGSAAQATNAFGLLRAATVARTTWPGVVIAVVGAGSDDPVAEVAAGLGRSLAAVGLDALVADAGPVPDAEAGGREPAVTSQPAGTGRSLDRVASARFRALLQQLRAEHDFVVVAAPSAATADGLAVGLAADAVVLCVTDTVTHRSSVHVILDRLDQLRIDVVAIAAATAPTRPRRLARFGRRSAPVPTHHAAGQDAKADRGGASASARTAVDPGAAR